MLICYVRNYSITRKINSILLDLNKDPNDSRILEKCNDNKSKLDCPKIDTKFPERLLEISDSSENILPPGCDYATYKIDYKKKYDMCVIGAGLSGTVFAERTANLSNDTVLMLESRPHIGGNLFDFVDQKTGLMRNQYGSHLFHTNIERVWKYINSNPNAPEWKPWYHQKFGLINGTLYDGMKDGNYFVPIPVNILTVNRLFGLNIKTEDQMNDWLKTVQIPCNPDTGCQNAEEMAKSRVGEALYKAIFETYTIKQWDKSPKDMDASVTARIPVRSDFDPRYFADTWQVLPEKGYTAWFEAMLDHPQIDVVLKNDFFDHQKHLEGPACKKIIYTGPIDRYFGSSGLEKLEYRSITFTEERHYNFPGYVLPTPVVNYPGPETPYTRAVEYKHYLHQDSPHTIVVKETTSDDGEPYYPVPNPRNIALYEKYKNMAAEIEKKGKFVFVGRLANYKYFDMDKAINNALELFDKSLPMKWFEYFKGQHFDSYRKHIDDKIMFRRISRKQLLDSLPSDESRNKTKCDHPLWRGEFGMELRVMIPWAYYKTTHRCLYLETYGIVGSKYLYWFSDKHNIENPSVKREKVRKLPKNNPFNNRSVHIPDFPYDTKWQSPPHKDVFARPEIREMLKGKPLLVIQNKYSIEWPKRFNEPINFMNVRLLSDMLDYLTPNYTVLYKRFTDKALEDHQDLKDLEEKQIIRTKFPSVIIYDDLAEGLTDVEDQNLLMFGLMSLSDHFLSIQGGTAVVSSLFGGKNIILIKEGMELTYGDYGYFHRFSNATVIWKKNNEEYLKAIKQIM